MTPASRTSAVLLTPRGRGAVASIAVTCGDSLLVEIGARFFRAANGQALPAQPLDRIVYGEWGDRSAEAASTEDVVLCRATPELLEIHCHGGMAAAERILHDLAALGIPTRDWQSEWKAAGSIIDAECRIQLSRATTLRTAKLLLEQSRGALRLELERLANLARTDFAGKRDELERRLRELLRWSDFGRHLVEPWLVVLTGRPNVGKSSLMNVLLGFERSIVFDLPGTTRDVVTSQTAFDGWPVELADTAGLRDAGDRLEAAGIERAEALLQRADCRVVLIDISEPPTAEDRELLAAWPDALVVAHKADLPLCWPVPLPEGCWRVSSKTGEGARRLMDGIARRLIPETPPPGVPIPVTERQVAHLESALRAVQADHPDACRAAFEELLHPPPP